MTTHRCNTCGLKHAPPKAWRIFRALALSVTFGVIEVLAALQLDGTLSWALWGIAFWNALLLLTMVAGLSVTAVDWHQRVEEQA
jgi:hypothetical protein